MMISFEKFFSSHCIDDTLFRLRASSKLNLAFRRRRRNHDRMKAKAAAHAQAAAAADLFGLRARAKRSRRRRRWRNYSVGRAHTGNNISGLLKTFSIWQTHRKIDGFPHFLINDETRPFFYISDSV
jgi:hypothetical protein